VGRSVLLACALVTALMSALVVLSVPQDRATARPGTTAFCAGSERTRVKVLADPDAAAVSLTPRATTVSALRALPRPQRVEAGTPRLRPFEFRTYRVDARLVAGHRNLANGDEDLIVSDDAGKTMIVVFPDENCPIFDESEQSDTMHAAKDSFTAECGGLLSATGWTALTGRIIVSGVAFFDVRHARPERRAAPNLIQLHPVLDEQIRDCRRP
jgi:hypothetical protein